MSLNQLTLIYVNDNQEVKITTTPFNVVVSRLQLQYKRVAEAFKVFRLSLFLSHIIVVKYFSAGCFGASVEFRNVKNIFL